jgi:hypothetical protein
MSSNVNIYGIYVTRSREEREYFKKIKIKHSFAQIVHLDFKYNQIVKNMKYFRQKMIVTVYFNKTNYKKVIYNLDDLIALFTIIQNGNPNVFIYSGHGNGIMLMKKNIRPLRTEDFCEIIAKTVKKADLVIYDCCLHGNIACLTITYPFAKYVIASTSYQSDISILIADNLYCFNGNLLNYCKNILHEIILKESEYNYNYITDFVLYEMNKNILKIAEITLKSKHLFDYHKSYVIDYSYYKDLNCSFKEIGINIEPLLNKTVKYQRYNQTKCINHKIYLNKDNESSGSKLIVVVKNPIKNGLPTQSDKFFK